MADARLHQGVAFRSPTLTLYTTSLDRTVSIFSLSTLSHLETLYGHQDPPTSLSTLRAETLVTSGARDRTVRLWKVADESQLVFRGGGASKGVWGDDEDALEEREREDRARGKEGEGRSRALRRKRRIGMGKDAYREGSIDCVAMIDEQNFLSGGDSGSVSLHISHCRSVCSRRVISGPFRSGTSPRRSPSSRTTSRTACTSTRPRRRAFSPPHDGSRLSPVCPTATSSRLVRHPTLFQVVFPH
jgi:hypothetical protein